MRHRRTTPKLGRTPAHRKAMLRSMVTDLLRHERIRTTAPKARALRPVAERMITLGKRESLHARRQAARVIRSNEVVKKLFDTIAPRYAERPGGYTRITKLATRAGDHAEMAVIELVEAEMPERSKKKRRPAVEPKTKQTGPRTAAQDAAAAVAAAPDQDDAAAQPGADEAVQAAGPDAGDELEASPEQAEAAAPEEPVGPDAASEASEDEREDER